MLVTKMLDLHAGGTTRVATRLVAPVVACDTPRLVVPLLIGDAMEHTMLPVHWHAVGLVQSDVAMLVRVRPLAVLRAKRAVANATQARHGTSPLCAYRTRGGASNNSLLTVHVPQ